jgi:hypothetical protein
VVVVRLLWREEGRFEASWVVMRFAIEVRKEGGMV